jgi:hypothetical protein
MVGVRTTHKDYDAFAPKWKRVRDCIAGQDAMHAAAELYLPRLKNEADDAYRARVLRSDFFNGTWRTIDAMVGMAFRKPPTVDVPKAIKRYLDDINMAGLPMEGLAKECVEEVLGPGRVGILVDYPQAPANVSAITVAAAQSLGLRPTLQLYTTESIRNWKCTRIANAWVLSMVVLREVAMIAEDEFTDKVEDRYRVLDLGDDGKTYRQRVFKIEKEKDELLSETVPLMNGKPLDFIPFAICGASGKSDAIDEPPLIDLVDKNVAHYQVNADYRHGLHFTGLPTPYVAGYQPSEDAPKLYIGSQSAWVFPDPQAKVGYLEFQGQGLGALESALARIETQMALLGIRMIADETKQGVETLGATQIKRQGENSILSKTVQGVSQALEWALGVFAEWAGAAGEVAYQLNRDFMPVMMDGRELLALVGAVQAGVLSKQEFYELMQRGDVIDGEKSYELHQEEIASEGPTMPITVGSQGDITGDKAAPAKGTKAA